MTETNIKPKYCNTNDAAIYLGLSPRTLQKYRSEGRGPKFRTINNRSCYEFADLDDWIAAHHKSNRTGGI